MVDKAPAPATTSRAVGLQPRGLEVLDRAAPYPDGLRTLAGISFPGVQIMERFLIADVHADLPMSRDAGLLWLQGASPLVAFPLPGTDLWRLVAPASDGASGDLSPQEVLNLVTRRLHELSGYPLSIVRGVEWTSVFHIHRRLAQRYRQGRMLIAGDAAHVHSPIGGQGMNTSVGDAENLAWKLALVVHGHADPTLLDSYEAERRPIATEVLQSSGAMTGVVLGDTKLARMLRDHVFVPSLNLPVVQRLIWNHLSQLKISYRSGPLAGTSGWPLGARLRPGDRVPDLACLRLDGSRTRLHAELGSRWVLLTASTAKAHACAARARDRLGSDTVTILTPDAPRPEHVLLVRPDAHAGWCGRLSPTAVDAWLTGILSHGRSRPPTSAAGGSWKRRLARI